MVGCPVRDDTAPMATADRPAEASFDASLRSMISTNLNAHELREHPLDGRRAAAVAILVLDSDAVLHGEDHTPDGRIEVLDGVGDTDISGLTGRVDGTAGGASILLTRRSARLSSHSRQWAFPGGRIDEGETALEAAMRECHEEVGVELTESDLLGRLDDYPTRSGYVMSPFVFWVDGDRDPVANPDEVESVHRVGIHELQRHDSPRFVDIAESDRPVVQVPVGGDLIHAPTGAIIHQFRAVGLEGLGARVDEFEQPVFAWK